MIHWLVVSEILEVLWRFSPEILDVLFDHSSRSFKSVISTMVIAATNHTILSKSIKADLVGNLLKDPVDDHMI